VAIDLSKFIFIDNHAHSLLKDYLLLDAIAFRQCLSESRSMSQLETHLPASVFYADLLRQIGRLLPVGCESDLLDYRSRQPAGSYINTLWDDASVGALIIDDGFKPAEMLEPERLAALCARRIYRAGRIEAVLESCIDRASSFDGLIALFREEILGPAAGTAHAAAGKERLIRTVCLKTIAAYRGGLELALVSPGEARHDFDRTKARFAAGSRRITRCPLYHYLLLQAFEWAAESGLPVQVHCGIGDDDADLRQSNPLCFRSVLEGGRFAGTQFVFLHCYPYVKEAAYLASLYPNVYLDLSLSVSLASPRAADMVLDALAQSPATKILAGTDGHSIPETHWYGAFAWRRALGSALANLSSSGFMDRRQAEDAAARILHENARALYRLDDLV